MTTAAFGGFWQSRAVVTPSVTSRVYGSQRSALSAARWLASDAGRTSTVDAARVSPRTAYALRTYATDAVLDVVRDSNEPIQASTVRMAVRLLDEFVEDGGATPQVVLSSEGTPEISWIAAGNTFSVVFDPDSSYSIIATTSDGQCVLDRDFDANEFPPEDFRAECAEYLALIRSELRPPALVEVQ